MKKVNLFLMMLVVTIFSISIYAEKIPLSKKEPLIDPDRPRSVIFIPASAYVENSVLSVFFDYAVGDATICITSIDESILFSTIVDTAVEQEFVIPLDFCINGEYILKIKYGDTLLVGEFSL